VPRCFIATNPRQTATKSTVLCCKSVVPSLLAVGWSGLLPKIQAVENILPDCHVSTPPTKTQPNVRRELRQAASQFYANQVPVNDVVKFLSRGRGSFAAASFSFLCLEPSRLSPGTL
jgi:hypothetical protein